MLVHTMLHAALRPLVVLAMLTAMPLTAAPAYAVRTPSGTPSSEPTTELGQKQIAPVIRIEANPGPKPRPKPRATWTLPLEDYRLTGRFGATSGLWSSSHTGLDFAATLGTPISAVTDGVVTQSGYAGAYGLRTVVTAADGTAYWYAHQGSVSVVVGERVLAGEEIGLVGSTGNSTGPHLHLEVRTAAGVPQDPAWVLGKHGLDP